MSQFVDSVRTASNAELLGGSLLVLAALFVFARLLRLWLRKPDDWPEIEALQLDVYEIAGLSGGRLAVLKSALARLLHDKILALDAKNDAGDCGLFVQRPLPPGVHSLEQAVYGAVAESPGKSVAETFAGVFLVNISETPRADLSQSFAAVQEGLIHQHRLILSDSQRQLAVRLPLVLNLCGVFGLSWLLNAANIVAPGGPRQDIGTVLFLAILVALIFSFVGLGPVTLTRRGERLLALLRTVHQPLRAISEDWSQRSSREVALAVGLFGLVVLHRTPLADLLIAFRPVAEDNFAG
jgi:uncharacterized protein (TIGR04222 family)